MTDDNVSPTASAQATPQLLWPPNHQYVPLTVTVSASDGCTGISTITLTSVTSSEPDDAPGNRDGNTVTDIGSIVRDANVWTIQLRAERAEGGSGRVYRIVFEIRDGAGNVTPVEKTVTVPLNRSIK
jgi:hypothetical protein